MVKLWLGAFNLFLMSLLLMALVSATSEVSISPEKNQITPSEQAVYSITIKNNELEAQRYTFYSFQTGWIIEPYPLTDKIMNIPARGSYITKAVIRPTEDFPPGIYTLSAVIENVEKGERYSLTFKVYLAPEKLIQYLPSLKVNIDMDEKINPTESVSIRLRIENRNPLDLRDMKVRIQSEIPEFVKEAEVELVPLGEKEVEFTLTPNKFQQPKKYTLFFVFEHEDKDIKVIEKQIEVITLTPNFEITPKEETIYLKKFTELTIRNTGNVLNRQEVKYPITFWESFFTVGKITLKEESKQKYFAWDIELQPGEATMVQYTTNYRLLLYIVLLMLLFLGFYLYAKSPLVVMKTAVTTQGDNSSLSEIKVRLEVKNMSKVPLKNISIIDIVPAIAHVEESLDLGTLKPTEVKHVKQGTRVKWNLVELDAHEHRIITYKVRAKLNILGVFRLPRATVMYSQGRRTRKAYSNITRLGAE